MCMCALCNYTHEHTERTVRVPLDVILLYAHVPTADHHFASVDLHLHCSELCKFVRNFGSYEPPTADQKVFGVLEKLEA